MNTTGFILLHRKIFDNPLWQQLPAEWLKTWIAILLRANFQPSTWWDGSRQIDLPAGSFVTSIGKLAEMAKVSERQIRGTLTFLETTGAVTRVATSQYSIITINNWDTYQLPETLGDKRNDKRGDKPTTSETTNGRQASDKRATTEEQINNKKQQPARLESIRQALKKNRVSVRDQQHVVRMAEFASRLGASAEQLADFINSSAVERDARGQRVSASTLMLDIVREGFEAWLDSGAVIVQPKPPKKVTQIFDPTKHDMNLPEEDVAKWS